MIVDAVALDIVPPATYLDESTPTEWWPGYSITDRKRLYMTNQHIDSMTITIVINEPGIRKIALNDTQKVTIDNKYEYNITSLNEKPVTYDYLTTILFRNNTCSY